MDQLFARLGEIETLEAEAEGEVDVVTLLRLALKSELEASELAGLLDAHHARGRRQDAPRPAVRRRDEALRHDQPTPGRAGRGPRRLRSPGRRPQPALPVPARPAHHRRARRRRPLRQRGDRHGAQRPVRRTSAARSATRRPPASTPTIIQPEEEHHHHLGRRVPGEAMPPPPSSRSSPPRPCATRWPSPTSCATWPPRRPASTTSPSPDDPKESLMTEISTVAVLGAGTMGRGIAHVAALAGYTDPALRPYRRGPARRPRRRSTEPRQGRRAGQGARPTPPSAPARASTLHDRPRRAPSPGPTW